MKLSEIVQKIYILSVTKFIIGRRPITWKLGFGELPITGGNPTGTYLKFLAAIWPLHSHCPKWVVAK